MSKILITAHGSTGDILAPVRLGRELIRRGHEVRMAVNPWQAEKVSRWGVPSIPIGVSFGPENWVKLLEVVNIEDLCSIKALPYVANNFLKPFLAPTYRDFLPLVPDYDVVLANITALWAKPASEMYKKKYVAMIFAAINIYSRFHPPGGAAHDNPVTKREILRNFLLWKFRSLVIRHKFTKPLRESYHELGLAFPKTLFNESRFSRDLTLLPLDPLWVKRAPDWPQTMVQTGFFRPQPDDTFAIPDDVREFVERKDPRPLLVFAFGSVYRKDPRSLYEKLIAAIRRAGFRTLIVESWGGPTGLSEEDILSTPFVPYGWLFKYATIVVSQGGVATISDCMLAAVPQLVVAHFGDQPDNGRRMQRLGLGRTMMISELTPERFEQELSHITANLHTFREQAKLISSRLQPNGLEDCADAVERIL